MLSSIDFQLSVISPVVRQLLPTAGAHVAGVSTPHSIPNVQQKNQSTNMRCKVFAKMPELNFLATEYRIDLSFVCLKEQGLKNKFV
jgi:hypothetical protein